MTVSWITLLIWFLFGCATAHFAKQRGRDPFSWFFIGLLLGAIGLCLVFIFPKRQVAAQTVQTPEPVDLLPELPLEHKNKFWYYLDGANAQVGPMSFEALFREFKSGKVKSQTHVWNENLEQWTPLSVFVKNPTS